LNRSLRIQIPAIIATRVVINTMIRMVYPFLPVFGRGLGVDLALLSLAVTFRSAAGVFGPFLAAIADRRGRKAGILFGITLFTIGAALLGFWPGYPAFVLTLVLTILGNFVFIPSMQAYLGDRVPYARRGMALALTEFGWSLSFILGVPLMGFLIARWGWIAPFPFLSAAGLLSLGLLAWLLPRDKPVPDQQWNLWRNLRAVLGYKPAQAGIFLGLSISAANEVVNLVFGVWMEDSFGLKIAALGAASAVIGFSELGGESLVSLITDRVGKSRAVAAGLALNCLAALLLPVLGVSLPGALAGLFLFFISFEFTIVSCIPIMTEVMPQARATLMSIFIAALSLGRALGASASSALYQRGFVFTILAAVTFNLAALLALHFLERGARQPSEV
jgi:MFS transporter, DHA1 family, inner membrane transport protein